MSRIDDFKNRLTGGERKFIEDYEESIYELFTLIHKDGLLNTKITKQQADYLLNYYETRRSISNIYNNVTELFKNEQYNTKDIIDEFGARGFIIEKPELQYCNILALAYASNAEWFKIHLITYIDCLKLCGKTYPTLGYLLKELQTKYPDNKFINYFTPERRNSISHFSYFVKRTTFFFCSIPFDPEPETVELTKFLLEFKLFNILSESFTAIYMDLFIPQQI